MRGEIRILVRYSQMRIGVCRKPDNAGSGEAPRGYPESQLRRSPGAIGVPDVPGVPGVNYGVGDPNLFNRDSFRRCRKTSSLCCCSVVSIG